MGLYFQKEIQKKSIKSIKNIQSENKNNFNHKDYMFMPYPWIKYIREFTADNTRDIYPKWVQIYDTISNKIIRN